jgi:hypothetical protein
MSAGSRLAGRSVGRVAVPAVALVLVLNVVLRDTMWAREWMWALYQYHFVTTLLGPVVAGLGAWEGVRWSSSSDMVAVSRRPIGAPAAVWGWLWSWVSVVYVAGMVAVGVFAAWSGAPGWPPLRGVLTVLPALGLLGALAGVGMLLGRFFPSALTPPLAAVAVFGLIVLGYTGPVGPFVTVGGATGGLLHLRPRLDIQIGQVLVYLSVVVAAVLLVAHGRRRPTLRSAIAPAAAGCVLLLVGGLLVSRGTEALELAPADIRCDDGDPVFCVADGYWDLVEPTRQRLAPYLEAIGTAGLPPPRGFTQALPRGVGMGDIDRFTLTRNEPADLEWSIVSSYFPSGCDLSEPPYSEAFDGLLSWLRLQTDPRSQPHPADPEVFHGGDDEAVATWLREAVDTLATCPGSL